MVVVVAGVVVVASSSSSSSNLVQYARKVVGDMYETSNSRVRFLSVGTLL